MQSLVYILIALAGLAVGAATYFGLTFSPIEALMATLVFVAVAIVLLERALRRRSEARLEKAIGDLSRLLSTEAQAGAALSRRVNDMASRKVGERLEAIEADMSVLGTVVRQVAEAVADMENQSGGGPVKHVAPPVDDDTFPDPVVPIESLREAMAEGRLVCHVEPIAVLPQRKPHGYTILPRLRMEDGEMADPPDFMPRRGGAELIRQIEDIALAEAVVIARRTRTGGGELVMHTPLSRATLSEPEAVQNLLAMLEANRAVAANVAFDVTQADFRAMTPRERAAMTTIARTGFGFSLAAASSLRIDFAELQGLKVRTVQIDAHRFITQPQTFTEFHSDDAVAYARRYDIELFATRVADEKQILSLFEDGITLVQGPRIGAPGPVRADLSLAPRAATNPATETLAAGRARP